MNNFPAVTDHIIALLFGLVLPVVSGVRSTKSFKTLRLNKPQRKQFFISNSLFLWAATAIVLIVWWLYSRPFKMLGLLSIPKFTTLVILLTAGFIILYIADLFFSLKDKNETEATRLQWLQSAPFMPRHISELPAYTFMCATAGICEEIIYRGYLIPYAQSFLTDIWAVVLPAIVFAVAHYYQGIKAVIKIALLAILFGFIFIYSGSLWIVIILHFGVDLAGGLLSMKLLPEEANFEEPYTDLFEPDEELNEGQQ